MERLTEDGRQQGATVLLGGKRLARREVNQRVEALLHRMQLEGLGKRYPSQLSGGQRQRVALARALIVEPETLLLDEPLAGMGAEETERMLGLLHELKRSHAVLLVEHDMDAVFRVADMITVMVNGEVIASDTPDVIRSHPEVIVAYLGEDHA